MQSSMWCQQQKQLISSRCRDHPTYFSSRMLCNLKEFLEVINSFKVDTPNPRTDSVQQPAMELKEVRQETTPVDASLLAIGSTLKQIIDDKCVFS